MMKTKLAIALIIVATLTSCGTKEKPVSERIKSKEISEIKSALADIWRLKLSEHVVDAAGFLSDVETAQQAAFTLAAMPGPAADRVVLNKMQAAKDRAAGLLYFYLSSRARQIPADILAEIDKAQYSGPEKIIYEMVRSASGDKKACARAFAEYRRYKMFGYDEAEKELILLAGITREASALPDLKRAGRENKCLAPFSDWAINRITGKTGIKRDAADKVITYNPYWKKYENNPVMPTVPGTYKSVHTANPDILVNKGTVYFYYRGGDGHDRICVATVPFDYFDGIKFLDHPGNPVISIGRNSFDDLAVLDPAMLYFGGKVFGYYSGLGTVKPDSVGLAVSKDFYNFTKAKKNPVFPGRAPEVVYKDGIIYMFYVVPNMRQGYSIFLSTSKDGYNFTPYSDKPVFNYNVEEGSWDSKTVTTQRIVENNGVYYMFYSGDDTYIDYPPYFGLAFSYDLINWYRGTQNPVFSRGPAGQWDDGGIWYPEVFPYKNKLYLYYEGWGGGKSHVQQYGEGGHSQIGLATSDYNLEDML